MKQERLLVLFLFGFVLLNAPVLTIFSRDTGVGGIPLLYVYIFVVWTVLTGLTAWIVEQSPDRLDS